MLAANDDQTLIMGTKVGPEMVVIFNQLTWLMAQEDFIKVASLMGQNGLEVVFENY
jgi:hypothetical protein